MESAKNGAINDVRQSREYGEYIKKIGWRVERVEGINVFIRSLGWLGSIAKIQRVYLPIPWEKVKRILSKNRVWMTKIEPESERAGELEKLHRHGFRQDNWPLLATKTIRIDLDQSTEGLLKSFKKDCRYILRKCLMLNAQCSINRFDDFYEIWRRSAKRKSLWIPAEREYLALKDSFGKNCFCITVNGQAGALVLIYDKTAYYYYAGATKEGTKTNLPYIVVWEGMKEAKKRKCRIWDFEGVYDERWPNKGWRGFTHFKRSFGGREIEFLGSFTRWL